jgi:hypothetical protein
MKAKSPITVRRAVEIVYAELPEHFHAPFFCTAVKARTGRWALMDGTILRRLREARADNPAFNYRCEDATISLYAKITPPEAKLATFSGGAVK